MSLYSLERSARSGYKVSVCWQVQSGDEQKVSELKGILKSVGINQTCLFRFSSIELNNFFYSFKEENATSFFHSFSKGL